MPRCRFEYDSDEHDPDTAQLADTVRRLLTAQHSGQLIESVRLAGVIERAAEQVTGRMLLAADASHGGPATRRALAEAYGREDHGSIDHRITATQHGAPRSSTHTVAGCRVRPGDLVTDPSGDTVGYGVVIEIQRSGAHWIALTESGQQLTFLPFDLVTIIRSPGNGQA